MPLTPDERVRAWLLLRVRDYVPMDAAHLHYRDCPRLVVESFHSVTSPLSDVTTDEYTTFTAQWGCEHGPERMTAHIYQQPGSLAEIIADLDSIESLQLRAIAALEPFYSLVYPAPEERSMSLTRAEKAAGRVFRDERAAALAALHAAEPADLTLPVVLHHLRHECTSRGGRSTSFEMREVREPSPRYVVCYCGTVAELPPYQGPPEEDVSPHPLEDHDCGPGVLVQAGRLAFIYKAGKCGCGLTGRSRDGQLVDARERPPLGRT